MNIENAVYNVVDTLRKFELGFTSVKRNPIDYQIRVSSLEEFIECRLNYELFKIAELARAEELMDGYLFVVRYINGARGNRFNQAVIELSTTCPSNMSEDEFNELMSEVESIIGGRSLTFSSNRNNLSLIIS